MPDVFLSYSHTDKDAARRVTERLSAAGWTTWWDQTLVPGETWAEVTRTELRSARAVVALWSEASWPSRWVQAEAYAGYEGRRLVCARLDNVVIEPPFNILQTADLRTPDGLERLVAGVARVMEAAPQPAVAAPAPESRRVRLAVMPFDNLSPDPANAFFADGMHEQILSALAASARSIELISRTTMISFRGRAASVAAIREELRCTHLLEGTVRREGDAMRLTVQLIDAGEDQHLWSQDFDRTLTNALVLQSEVAAEVAAHLFVKLARSPAPKKAPAVDPRAFDLYLKARIARQSLGAVADPMPIWRGIEAMLDEAIARDPGFAPAYVERAAGAWYCVISNFDTTPARLERMRADLRTLESLAPNDPAVTAIKGLSAFADQDYGTALALLSRAEELGLADPDLLQWRAFLLSRLGRQDEARVIFDRLISLDPGNLFLLLFVLTSEMAAKRPDHAERIIDLGLTRSPGNIIWFALRANLRALFNGETADRASMFDLLYQNMAASGFDPEGFIAFYLELLIFARRFDEALAVLDQPGRENFIMIWYASLSVVGLGRFPLAVARGKINLLLGRCEDARADGDACLAFHAAQTPLPTNAWALAALRAYGLMLRQENGAAQDAAREALDMARASPDAVHRAAAHHLAAQVFAFTGGLDAGAALLEASYDSKPGIAPIYVVADPGFAVPLAKTPAYLALVARAEADMLKARGG